MPCALTEAVENELDRQSRNLKASRLSKWAAPIISVAKEDGTVRMCGDYKLTVNQAAALYNYPVPKTEDLLATFNGLSYSAS